jgi:hypothetical protein
MTTNKAIQNIPFIHEGEIMRLTKPFYKAAGALEKEGLKGFKKQRAEEALQKAVRSSKFKKAFSLLANAYAHESKADKTREPTKKLTYKVTLCRSTLLHYAGHVDEAISLLEDEMRGENTHGALYIRLAELLGVSGKAQEGREILKDLQGYDDMEEAESLNGIPLPKLIEAFEDHLAAEETLRALQKQKTNEPR